MLSTTISTEHEHARDTAVALCVRHARKHGISRRILLLLTAYLFPIGSPFRVANLRFLTIFSDSTKRKGGRVVECT
jgi:hypothetical protein